MSYKIILLRFPTLPPQFFSGKGNGYAVSQRRHSEGALEPAVVDSIKQFVIHEKIPLLREPFSIAAGNGLLLPGKKRVKPPKKKKGA